MLLQDYTLINCKLTVANLKIKLHNNWNSFLEKGPSAYIITFPVRAVEMLRLGRNVWLIKNDS